MFQKPVEPELDEFFEQIMIFLTTFMIFDAAIRCT